MLTLLATGQEKLGDGIAAQRCDLGRSTDQRRWRRADRFVLVAGRIVTKPPCVLFVLRASEEKTSSRLIVLLVVCCIQSRLAKVYFRISTARLSCSFCSSGRVHFTEVTPPDLGYWTRGARLDRLGLGAWQVQPTASSNRLFAVAKPHMHGSTTHKLTRKQPP